MAILQEFREFAMKGNVVDLAVGVIIGAAFGKIVTSLVNDVIMPPIGLMMGGVDFKNLYVALKGPSNGGAWESLAKATEAGVPIIRYGSFLQTVLDFVIVAFCIFIMVKQVNRFSTPAKK